MPTNRNVDDLYYKRMRASLDDKYRIVDAIVLDAKNKGIEHPHVLDIGAGDGTLAQALTDNGCIVSTCDTSPESLKRLEDFYQQAHRQYVYEHTNIEPKAPINVSATEIVTAFPLASFDAIIFSSVLHEVYSYGTNDNHLCFTPHTDTTLPMWRNDPRINEVLLAIREAWFLLKPDGLLVIRDGVQDPRVMTSVSLRPKTKTAEQLIDTCRALLGFTSDDICLLGYTMSQAQRVLYTITWGPKSLLRECQENRWFFLEREWIRCLEQCHFDQIQTAVTTLPGYYDALSPQVDLLYEGRKVPREDWPVTTIFITAHKPTET